MQPPTQDELVKTILSCLDLLDRADPSANTLLGYLYKPHSALGGLIRQLDEYAKIKKPSKVARENAGRLMEQIAGVCFAQLTGVSALKSFQSAAAQYDLLVSGDSIGWSTVTKMLYMTDGRRDILVEAKARGKKVTDKEFSRLIGIMETHLSIVGLGIFFTIHGATGFPKPGAPQRVLRDCQLRQALYFAKTERPILVFDLGDIASLNAAGALPSLIARKVRALSQLCVHPFDPLPALVEETLPPHILSVLGKSS